MLIVTFDSVTAEGDLLLNCMQSIHHVFRLNPFVDQLMINIIMSPVQKYVSLGRREASFDKKVSISPGPYKKACMAKINPGLLFTK